MRGRAYPRWIHRLGGLGSPRSPSGSDAHSSEGNTGQGERAGDTGVEDVRLPEGGVASQRLLQLSAQLSSQGSVSIGEVVDRLGASSLGLVLLILTIPAIIPIPGPIGIVTGAC